MTYRRLRNADLLLDEFVGRLDPMPWYGPQISSLPLQRQCELVLELAAEGYLQRVGVRRTVWEDGRRPRETNTDILYGPTQAGLEFWEKHVKGRRRITSNMTPYPKHRESALVAAKNPCTVFDLARAPWRHKMFRDLE